MENTTTISQVMTIAHKVRKINSKNWLNGAKKFTWSECLRLAWKLVQKFETATTDTVSAMIEIMRPNRVGKMRPAGSVGMRWTF